MDGVSSVAAVVSLAIQLVDSIQEARTFLRGVQTAPAELVRLVKTVEQLDSVLRYVKTLLEQQLLALRLPGTPTFILDALQDCANKMKPLQRVVDQARASTNQRRRTQRVWASTKLAFKKEEIQDLERQLRDAKSDLHLAITENLWQLQMHQLKLIGVHVTKTAEDHTLPDAQPGATAQPDNSEMMSFPVRPKSLVSSTYQETNELWYWGIFGRVWIQKRAEFSSQLPCLTASVSKPLTEETAIMIAPSFLRRLLEVRLAFSLGKISRTLTVYTVVTDNSPIIDMCEMGDIHGLQTVFGSGKMSPFIVNEWGVTLLHFAALTSNIELCSWLLELGIDPHLTGSNGSKALHYACSHDGAELILSQQCELEDDPAQKGVSGSGHFFAIALRYFGAGGRPWEALIRKLIRKGVDVHGRVNRRSIKIHNFDAHSMHDPSDARDLWLYGTPLDDLFAGFFDLSPAEDCKESADAWLQILSSEGFDVQAYLKEEVANHAAHKQLTWTSPSVPELRRQLCFKMGENPSVWWEWQPHPLSPILLAQMEYRHITLDLDDRKLGMDFGVPWQDRWPFDHPEWSNDPRMWKHDPHLATMIEDVAGWKWTPDWQPIPVYRTLKWSPERQRLNRLAQERADRRFAKKHRNFRQAQEGGLISQMPGSWPE